MPTLLTKYDFGLPSKQSKPFSFSDVGLNTALGRLQAIFSQSVGGTLHNYVAA